MSNGADDMNTVAVVEDAHSDDEQESVEAPRDEKKSGFDEAKDNKESSRDEVDHEGSLAQGMYMTMWPKVEKCQGYVSVLLAAQAQLQQTVDKLIANLKEAEEADKCSLVRYADRLKDFPKRVDRLQHQLEVIEDRLLSMKEARHRGASCVAKFDPQSAYASPLF